MSNGSKLAMLFALALSAASTTAVNAHPAILGNGPGGQAAAPIVKVDCYEEGCEYRRWHCWRRCDDCCEDYWPRAPAARTAAVTIAGITATIAGAPITAIGGGIGTGPAGKTDTNRQKMGSTRHQFATLPPHRRPGVQA